MQLQVRDKFIINIVNVYSLFKFIDSKFKKYNMPGYSIVLNSRKREKKVVNKAIKVTYMYTYITYMCTKVLNKHA